MSSEVEEALQILYMLQDQGATARALGGIGVCLRCPSTQNGSALARTYSDLDLVTNRASASTVASVVEAAGYEPARRFNAAHGRKRLLFINGTGRHVDVFINTFTMCHELPLERRLTIDRQTLSLADLLLTKLQIAQLNEKDVIDVSALVADHDLSEDESGVNVEYISQLLSQDWGWWRTVTDNLATVREKAPGLGLSRSIVDRLERSASHLLQAVNDKPKSMKWRVRAKVGERAPWRDEPEELEH